MMRRRTFVFGLIASYWMIVTRAAAWRLITDKEFEKEGGTSHTAPVPLVTQPGAPTIEVNEPDDSKPIKSPVTIRISFHPQGNAKIVVKSFRATYGFLGIDITQRIVDNAQLTAGGLFAKDAQLPPGHHLVTLQIADSMQRVGERTMRFTIS